MHAATCPFCGRNGETQHRGANGFRQRGDSDSRTPAAIGTLDRVMNWITGVLLITGAIASVVFHSRPL